MTTANRYEYRITTDLLDDRPSIERTGISKGAAIKHARISKAGGALHVVIWRRVASVPKLAEPWAEWKWVNQHNQITMPNPSRTAI